MTTLLLSNQTRESMNDHVPDQLLDRLKKSLAGMLVSAPGIKGIVVAFSGGMDSTVLLDLCARLKDQSSSSCLFQTLKWRAIHVNHGLNPGADHWQQHCLHVCQQLEIPCQSFSLKLAEQPKSSSGEGLEAMARQQRYRTMASNLGGDEVLLTAHHAQDQGETVLFRLLRGAGPRGLSGMSLMATVPESSGMPLWRPLLGEDPVCLRRYAEQRSLQWIEDSSNRDTAFSRNYLRHEVVPAIARRWPGWMSSVERSADACRESDALLQSLAEQWLDDCRGKLPGQLSIAALLQKTPPERDVMLRQWLWRHGRQWAGRVVLDQIAAVLTAAEDRQPELAWQGYLIRRYRDELMMTQVLPELAVPPGKGYAWPCFPAVNETEIPSLALPGNGSLSMVLAGPGEGMRLPIEVCHVRYRQEGIRARLPGRPVKSLKQLWQEAGVPPWLRDRAPLLYVDEQLAWIAGVGVCEGFAVTGSERGWIPCWEQPGMVQNTDSQPSRRYGEK